MDKINGIEELQETNSGFRFLFNKDQTQSSAMLFLQWCLAPQVAQYLKKAEVTDAKVFITVRNPNGRETRYVAPLTSPQELIEFHRPRNHEISGTVVWGDDINRARRDFLRKNDRYSYEWDSERAISRNNCQSFGTAELSLDVADGFFAPEMSPRKSWYVNLWFGEPAWDECEIRRRKMIAYFVQTPLLAVWIPILFTVRLVYALWLSVMCLRENVPWEAVIHPFSCTTAEIEYRSEKRWDGTLWRLFVPANQIIIVAMSILLTFPVYKLTGQVSWEVLLSVYGAIMILAIMSKLLPSLVAENIRRYQERLNEQEKAARMDRLYSDLLCTTAPVDGALRTRRHGFKNNAVLAYHNFKAAVCRPTARG